MFRLLQSHHQAYFLKEQIQHIMAYNAIWDPKCLQYALQLL
jgi:hypothetical protein